MSIYLVRDVTDPHLLQPEAEAILSLYNLNEEKGKGVHFRYKEIADMVLMPAIDIHLPDEATGEKLNREDKPMYREQKILEFYDSVKKVIDVKSQTVSDTSSLSYSECFQTLCGELSLLAAEESGKRVLLLFSNLQENSRILSVFKNNTQKVAKDTPQAIAAIFEQTNLLPATLAGITVIFCYMPKDREDDFSYSIMASIFKRLLEKKGAIVYIQADNKNYAVR